MRKFMYGYEHNISAMCDALWKRNCDLLFHPNSLENTRLRQQQNPGYFDKQLEEQIIKKIESVPFF